MILLWGLMQDSATACVRAALDAAGADVAFLDQRKVLESMIELESGPEVRGLVVVGDTSIDLDEVAATYVRPYDSAFLRVVADTEPGSAVRRHAADFDDALWTWADLTPARVVNRPSTMSGTASKPRQGAPIAAHGLRFPETLVTTDAEAVREFAAATGPLVYKSTSSVRSIVSRLRPDDDRLADLAWCPTQFQEFVPGDDYRVHVVGGDVFGCRIQSPADDYRYAAKQGHSLEMTPFDVPEDLAGSCTALTAYLGLLLAGLDLRRTPDGEWYCFEVNSSPAFPFYDRHGQGIGRAVARLLMDAESEVP